MDFFIGIFTQVRRVAAGAGVLEKEVQELLKQYAKFAQVGTELRVSSQPLSPAGGEKDGRH